MNDTILIVDDEEEMLHLLKRSLGPELKCEILAAGSGEEALRVLESTEVDLALVDMKMPGMDGLELLERIRADHPWLTVVMMTAYGSIDAAVQAIKLGAYDFLTKPFDHDVLVLNLNKALERSRLIHENLRFKRCMRETEVFQNLVGKSAPMRRIFETIQTVAKTDLSVLITGESGTGKDLVAHALHDLSGRCSRSFVAVNCPAVPENILESELFGYRKGAFTHAVQNRTGLFQEAHRGTIFLDEIGDISTGIQTKLLRVLQEKEIKPLGDTRSIHVDVRVIASTNRNLPEKIKKGEFREDLYYRLNVLPIETPPLRDRRDDIPLIAVHLLNKHSTELGRPEKRISPDLMQAFMAAPWTGNVRELENLVIRGIMFSTGDEILPEDVGLSRGMRRIAGGHAENPGLGYKEAKEEILRRFHADFIGKILARTEGNVTRAARECGLERQALQQLMRRYGLRSEDYR
ncbi:MAG: sigma-54 dependent transcriptional regulator [Syntrophobacteraceae bacterium]